MDLDRVKQFCAADHEKIEGWFFALDQLAFYELFVIQNDLRLSGDVAEIGVYKGKSLVLLSLLREAFQKIMGFDLFAEDHEEATLHNLKTYGCEDNISLIKGLTSDIGVEKLDALIPTPLRFIHIDAGHEYHEVLEQLLIFAPYAADHCIIAMDDYQDREFPGIEAAVLEFAEIDRPRRFVPFLSGGNKLFMCLERFAGTYQKAVLARPGFKDMCRLTHVKDFRILILRSKIPVASEDILNELNSVTFPSRLDTYSLNEKSKKFAQIR